MFNDAKNELLESYRSGKASHEKGVEFFDALLDLGDMEMFNTLANISKDEAAELRRALLDADLASSASLFDSFYKHRDDVKFKKVWAGNKDTSNE